MRLLLAFVALLVAACGQAPRRNLVLITVDTLRADHLGAWGSRHGATPHLDALAESGVVFLEAWAPSPFTMGSTAALLTGRHPIENAIYSNKSLLQPDIETLATVLQEEGFATAAVVSNFALRRSVGLFRGFDSYDDRMTEREAFRPDVFERSAPGTTDAALNALDRLQDAGSPFFLWVHYQDPHGPYTPPAALRERYAAVARAAPDGGKRLPASASGHGGIPAYQRFAGEDEVAFYRAGYAGEVAFMDRQVGRLLASLGERGLLDASVLAFTADHGESLGEDDYWFAHGRLVSPALNRVPLILRSPDHAPEARGDVASLLDVMPTLLQAVGVRASADLGGRDLLAAGAGSHSSAVVLSAFGPQDRSGLVEEGRLYLAPPAGGDGPGSVVSLDGPAPSASETARLVRTMRTRWQALRADLAAGGRRERRGRIDAATTLRLRALGYAD